MTEIQRTYTNTDTVVVIPVTFDQGATISNLIGADIDVRGRSSNGSVTPGDAVLNNSGDTITVTFLGGSLPPGQCNVQVWAQAGAQRMMIHDFDLEVLVGYRPLP